MTEDNDNSYGLKDELDDCAEKEEIKEAEQISKSKLLKLLLECFKDVEGEYYLSAVLRNVSKEYEGKEDAVLQGIVELYNEEYIILSPKGVQKEAENPPYISPEQLIESRDYDNILIAFREQENKILLRNYVEAQISISEMQTQFENMKQRILKVEEFWETYNERELKSEELYNEFDRFYEEIKKEQGNLSKHQREVEEYQREVEEHQKKDKESLNGRIKEEVAKQVEEQAKGHADSKIEEELSRNGKIGSSLHDAQMNIIQFMAIFVAIFSLVSINATNAGKWDYVELFRVNVVFTTAMFTLVILIHLFTTADRKWIKGMVIIVCILWIVLACSAGLSLHLCYG